MDAILGLEMEEQAHARSEHSHHHHHHHDEDHHHHDEDHHHGHHHHAHDHGHDDFASHVISVGSVEDADAFQDEIAAIASEFGVLRAKGRVDVAGKALPFVVQAVGRRVDGYFARDRDAASGRLVVIGMAGLDAVAIARRLGGQVLEDHASS